MLRYRKGAEPDELKSMRSTPDASYGSLGTSEKDPLRAALVRDQGFLCAYCQQRIQPSPDSMDVEHWLAQSKHKEEDRTWSHMLGVCKGVMKVAGKPVQHCDRARGNSPLFLHPVEGMGPDPCALLHYDEQGRIWSKDERAQRDIRTLNLDGDEEVNILRSNRKAAAGELQRQVTKRGCSLGSIDQLLRVYQLQGGTKASTFLELTRYLLRKWRRRFEPQGQSQK